MSKQIEAISLVEAAKQALEAIANSGDFLFNWHDCEPNNEREMSRYQEVSEMNEKAFTALRTAINAAELREEAEQERSSVKQEPVATVVSENKPVTMSWWHEPALPVGTKLYTTPPAAPVQEHEPENEPFVSLASVQSAERVEPVAHDYQIRYDRGCYKCRSHYCPGNCVAATPPGGRQSEELRSEEDCLTNVATPLAVQPAPVQKGS
jgi:hypothetical protein